MISIDGANKIVVLSVETSFNFNDVYMALVDWSALPENMQYLLPVQGTGKAVLGGGVYTDIIYTILNGWKIKPEGYTSGTQISVVGTIVSDDNTIFTIPPTSGGVPQWLFRVSTSGVVTVTGSGVTTQDKIDIADEIMTRGLLEEDNFLALK